MTALDGFPFNDLRSLLLSKGYSDLFKSVSTIHNRVVNYSYNIKKEIEAALTVLNSEGQRFSMSFDE